MESGHGEIERAVLEKITPREEERKSVEEAVRTIVEALRGVLRERGVEAEVTVQGSFAHDTWLSGDRDVDVFILYPQTWSEEELRGKGFELILEACKKLGNYQLRYAQHPYVRVRIGEVEADVVPGYKAPSAREVKTAVDRTPLHTAYVNSRLTDQLRAGVRLLKKFMKGVGVYGAEVKTRGFSGYAAELLVIHYGGFRLVLEEASKWRPPVFIDTVGGGQQLYKSLRRKYPDSLVYMPDPVDPARNVAANVGPRALYTFILAANCYLKHPSEEYFFPKTQAPSMEEVLGAAKNRGIVAVEYVLDNPLPPDVIWGEVYRVRDAVVGLLATLGVEVYDADAWTDESRRAVILVETPSIYLSAHKLYRGPAPPEPERALDFLFKHLGKGDIVWVSWDGELRALSKRPVDTVANLLKTRWREYSVAPHFKGVEPLVYVLDEPGVERLIEIGAFTWASSFISKTPSWMAKCIS